MTPPPIKPHDPTNEIEQLKDQVSHLELKVAYHERLNQELSDQVYSLHKEIATLRNLINQRLNGEGAQEGTSTQFGPAQDKPPHY